MFHKAFWDHIEEQLNANPPDYVPAIQLIEVIKQVHSVYSILSFFSLM